MSRSQSKKRKNAPVDEEDDSLQKACFYVVRAFSSPPRLLLHAFLLFGLRFHAMKQIDTCDLGHSFLLFAIMPCLYASTFAVHARARVVVCLTFTGNANILYRLFCVVVQPPNTAVPTDRPPASAEEYLALVRMEARTLPGTVLSDIDPKFFVHKQTAYMPKAGLCAPCPPGMQPSNEWETTFASDFADLRQVRSLLLLLCSPAPFSCFV